MNTKQAHTKIKTFLDQMATEVDNEDAKSDIRAYASDLLSDLQYLIDNETPTGTLYHDTEYAEHNTLNKPQQGV